MNNLFYLQQAIILTINNIKQLTQSINNEETIDKNAITCGFSILFASLRMYTNEATYTNFDYDSRSEDAIFYAYTWNNTQSTEDYLNELYSAFNQIVMEIENHYNFLLSRDNTYQINGDFNDFIQGFLPSFYQLCLHFLNNLDIDIQEIESLTNSIIHLSKYKELSIINYIQYTGDPYNVSLQMYIDLNNTN